MKNCSACLIDKDYRDFYKHKNTPDGHGSLCKSCSAIRQKVYLAKKRLDPEFIKKEKERNRYKHKTEYSVNRRLKYPEKITARNRCFKKEKGFNWHHWSYNEEHYTDVIKLSIEDHKYIHKFLKYDQGFKKYRTPDGVLLETKEDHIIHINDIMDGKYTFEYDRSLLEKRERRFRKKAVLQIKNNEVVNSYESITDASQKTGFGIGNISFALNGKRMSCGGYQWKLNNL